MCVYLSNYAVGLLLVEDKNKGKQIEQIEIIRAFAHEIHRETQIDATEGSKTDNRHLLIHEHPRFGVLVEKASKSVDVLYDYSENDWDLKEGFTPILIQCIVEAHAEDIVEICENLRSRVRQSLDKGTAAQLAGELLKQPDTHSHTAAYAILQELLDPFGLDFEVVSAWRQGCKREDLDTTIASNIDTIRKLEEHEQGVTKTLHEEFGICHFARYPEEILIRQYDMRDENREYGVIANPINDHNGAFYNNRNSIYDGLFKEMQSHGKEIRVVENGGKRDLGRSLNQLHRRYFKELQVGGNKSHRLSFVILGGHGSREVVQQGGGGQRERDYLTLDDLDKLDVKTLTALFEKGATVVLNSCSTGKEHGIAQKISEKVQNISVIAPEKRGYIKKLTTRVAGNSIAFRVEYETSKENKDGEIERVSVEDKTYKNRQLSKELK